MLGAHAEESTEAEHCVSNLARPLIDHKIFNAADLLAVRAIDGGSLNLIARDEIGSFLTRNFPALVHIGLSIRCRHLALLCPAN